MRDLIYHIATTLDGFIAHPDGSTKGFLEAGEHVADYLDSLKDYDTVIMGRKTYEYGYEYGLKPGQPAYAHMKHYLFSKTLAFDTPHEQVEVVREDPVGFVKELKETVGSPIYLCGGGQLAGLMLQHGLIDELWLKQNPVLFGVGIPLFGEVNAGFMLKPQHCIAYPNGVQLLQYRIHYDF